MELTIIKNEEIRKLSVEEIVKLLNEYFIYTARRKSLNTYPEMLQLNYESLNVFRRAINEGSDFIICKM